MRQIGVAGWTGLFDELLDGKSSSKFATAVWTASLGRLILALTR
jgi:hypothetical protein